MGIKQFLIDSRIQGFWYGHIKQAQTDAGREEGVAARSGMPACSGMWGSHPVGWARWVVTLMTPWVVHPLHWCRSHYADANATADDWQTSWLWQGVQKSIVSLSATCINSSHPPGRQRERVVSSRHISTF